ncbi:hypothetical protein O6H91_07G067200 [Diphasiastrum complanatum]|nr:hypothetical protein O6H91_07G067200 [Diphasiastrum complanatum]
MEWLRMVRLDGFLSLQWTLLHRDLVVEFLREYNVSTASSLIRGVAITVNEETLSQTLLLPADGEKDKPKGDVDHCSYFSPEAMVKDQGYMVSAAKSDATKARLNICTQLVQLKQNRRYCPRILVTTLLLAEQGIKINWASYLLPTLLKELRRIVANPLAAGVTFIGPLITLLLKNSLLLGKMDFQIMGALQEVGTEPREEASRTTSPERVRNFLAVPKTELQSTSETRQSVPMPHIDMGTPPKELALLPASSSCMERSPKDRLSHCLNEAQQAARELVIENAAHSDKLRMVVSQLHVATFSCQSEKALRHELQSRCNAMERDLKLSQEDLNNERETVEVLSNALGRAERSLKNTLDQLSTRKDELARAEYEMLELKSSLKCELEAKEKLQSICKKLQDTNVKQNHELHAWQEKSNKQGLEIVQLRADQRLWQLATDGLPIPDPVQISMRKWMSMMNEVEQLVKTQFHNLQAENEKLQQLIEELQQEEDRRKEDEKDEEAEQPEKKDENELDSLQCGLSKGKSQLQQASPERLAIYLLPAAAPSRSKNPTSPLPSISSSASSKKLKDNGGMKDQSSELTNEKS